MESSVAIDKTYNILIDTSEKLNQISEENKPVINCEQSSGDVIDEILANRDTKDESTKTSHEEVENKTNGDESPTNSTLNQFQKHKPRKRIAISESDSDTEGNLQIVELENITTSQNSSNDNDNVPEVSKIKNRKHVIMLQSDSEEEGSVPSSQMEKEASSNQKTINNLDSNSECEDNVISSRDITRKKVGLLDSDSDDEVIKTSSGIKSLRSRKSVNTSSSESDNEELKINSSRKSIGGELKRKKIIPENSGTEDEVITPHKSFSNNNQPQEMPIYTNDLEEEKLTKSSRWSALCDSESSADEINHSDVDKSVGQKSIMSEEKVSKPVLYRKKQPKKEKGPKKMTGKEAAEQRKEIRSESQRMTRESCISLPYHRPKSHSLREFLARRPKLASAVPLVAKTPPSVAIKMTVEQLEVISKKLEERHKEVKEFYKSDSEAENDDDDEKDDADYVPEIKRSSTVDNSTDENLANTNSILESILTNKEIEDLSSQNFCEKETSTINDKIDNKKDNDNTELMEVDNIDENIQKVVSECVLSEVEHVDKGEDKEVDAENLNKIDDITNNTVSGTNNEVEENIENSVTQSHNKSVELEQQLVEYEFNLDDMDEHSERIINSDNRSELVHQKDESMDELKEPSIENQQQIIDFSELDREIENFTRDSPPEQEKPKLSKMELLKERLSNIQPRLSSSANNIIDLDNIAKPTQVVQLMERFAKHTAKKEHHKDKIKLNIVNVESGGEIHKETVAVHVDDEEDTTIEEKPGVRLQRLRNELQTQIAQQKQQLWENKIKKEAKNVVDDEDPYKDEKSVCGADDDILDNDEEEEMTESSEDEDYDEEEEIEDATVDKPKKKSAFVDDEAMESDIEENEEQVVSDNEDQEDDDNVNADDEGDIEENEEDNSDEENNVEEINKSDENKENELKDEDEKDETTAFKKPLRRIIKGFTEDSDDDEDVQLSSVVSKIAEKLNRNNEDCNSTTQDDYITSYQLQNQKTPVRSKSDIKFLTPVSYIMGLQNLTNSASKVQSPTNVPSPLREANWHATLQKKLFADSIITNSQAEAMSQLCSERFQDSQVSTQDNLTTNSSTETSSSTKIPSLTSLDLNCSLDFEEAPSTQDLLNICSGEFTGISQISSNEVSKTCVNHTLNPVEEVKSLGEDQDMVISQLMNEEEMEAFKKKFDSPILIHSQKVIKEAEEVTGTGGVIDSDDDEGVLEVKKRKNQKKLTFSDDESSDDEEEEEREEEIDLHDEDQLDDETAADVNYDSEENEIEYADEKEDENLKINDFFEDEAELSESEWGSADEDEKDLDTLDFEKGDEEKFDEKQMRTDLERIHMRRMLDDDTREVKLLQEMLLDDGELHGSGRERQFKWKNIDSQGIVDDTRKNSDDDEIGFDEDESEEQWRRKRHEREMFLKKKESDDSDLLSKSEILKFGHKVVQRSSSNSQGSMLMEKSKVEIGSPSLKSTLGLLHKRGSFLSRGNQVLQKLAEYNKFSSTTTTTVAQKTKNSKNFLFQTVEVTAVNEKLSIFSKKRKALEGTPKAIKKLRLTDNLSPAVKKKKSNSKMKSNLFGVS